MPKINNDTLEISIKTNESDEMVTLHFEGADRSILVGMHLPEAQLICMLLSEAVTSMLLKKLQLVTPPEKLH